MIRVRPAPIRLDQDDISVGWDPEYPDEIRIGYSADDSFEENVRCPSIEIIRELLRRIDERL